MSDTPKMDVAKIFIGSPLYGSVFTRSHASQLMAVGLTPGITAGLFPDSCYLHINRNRIANAAIEAWKKGLATHVWWLDSDITLPPYSPRLDADGAELMDEQGRPLLIPTAHRMIMHNKAVVSGVYYLHSTSQPVIMGYDGDFLQHIPKHGLIKAGVVGFGCVMMRIDLLAEMQERFKDELFQMPIMPNGKSLGEDVFWCQRLNQMGVSIYVDCGIQCGHMKVEELNREGHEFVFGTDENPKVLPTVSDEEEKVVFSAA